MKVPTKIMVKAIKEEKILPFDDELINKLRTLKYYDVPLSIVLLCREFCRGACYPMSMNLTRAMDTFTLVHGDVNFLKPCED